MEREVTGKDTIPAGTAGTGTVSTNADFDNMLDVTGGDYSEWNNVTVLQYKNIWIYLVTAHLVAKVTDVIRRSDTSFTLILDRDMVGIAGDTFKIVEGNLVQFSATNDDDTIIADYNGVQFVPGKTFIEEYDARSPGGVGYKWKEVKTVDGNGATIVISENK